ncbi:citrate lyase acyl carrier protein, partial [bacterium]|nr:citrate lyase acyl carrier protein [candidate division CSSED10-310 bacterium]
MSEGQLATAGNKGSAVRSDCWISIKIETSGGIDIQMKSKVESLYGESNINLIRAMMSFYEIENAVITIEDSGALPFVIMARIEAVIRKLGLDQNKRYLPDWENTPPESSRDRFRRSR